MKTMERDRVRRQTSEESNRRIDDDLADAIDYYTGATPAVLTQRIEELGTEWDIERTLQTNASFLALAGVGLAIGKDQRWLALTGGVLGFLFLHGTQGWCPPLPLFRRLGVRTRSEIERERYALKLLRGDFDGVQQVMKQSPDSVARTVGR